MDMRVPLIQLLTNERIQIGTSVSLFDSGILFRVLRTSEIMATTYTCIIINGQNIPAFSFISHAIVSHHVPCTIMWMLVASILVACAFLLILHPKLISINMLYKVSCYVCPVTGLKAINKIQSSSSYKDVQMKDTISFVTVYTVYSNSNGSDSSRMDNKLSDLVTIGNKSYNKVERSMAILNAFIDFIQVIPCMKFKPCHQFIMWR